MPNDKDVFLMAEIMNAVSQSDEWQRIQLNDPSITEAGKRFERALEEAAELLPESLVEQLEEANSFEVSATADAAISFGLHVATVIQDVAADSAALSQLYLDRRMLNGR